MKVSVYCTAYNHEKYIESALDGFVKQKTTFDYEVFVHDDASTDGTAEIIRKYANQYPHIIKPIFQTENQYSKGILIFKDILLPKMTGEYIASCEGDDCWIDENKLQMQVDFLDSHPEYSACVHNCYMLDMRTRKQTVKFGEADYDIQIADALDGVAKHYQTASLMYRRKYAETLPVFYINTIKRGFGDYPMGIYLSLEGKIRYFGRIMSLYRFGTESSWTRKNSLDMRRCAKHEENVKAMLLEVNEYTDGKYWGQIEKLVLRSKYMALYFSEAYAELRKPAFKEIYAQEPFLNKIKMRMKQYLGLVYRLYRRVKYR